MPRTTTLLLSLLLLPEAMAQTQIYRFDGANRDDRLGNSVAGLGDVNRDGWPDFAVLETPFKSTRTVHVYSGKEGRKIWTLGQTAATATAYAGDVDRDGHADVLVGNSALTATTPNGSARLYSGRTGRMMFQWTGKSPVDVFAYALGGVGDVNLDGFPDIVITAPAAHSRQGKARLLSGRDGKLLRTLVAPGTYLLGTGIGRPGDINGDGHPDIALGSNGGAWLFSGKDGSLIRHMGLPPGYGASRFIAVVDDLDSDGKPEMAMQASDTQGRFVIVLSSKTGKILRRFALRRPRDNMTCLATIGDLDSDGKRELAFGAFRNYQDSGGYVQVVSAAKNRVLATLDGTTQGLRFGYPFPIANVGDLDANGIDEYIIGGWGPANTPPAAGSAIVFSGVPLSLTSSRRTVSVSNPAPLTFNLQLGSSRANQLYWLLGSASGNRPGFRLGSLLVPLNPDPYMVFTIGHPNSSVLQGSFGKLDSFGEASVVFSLPRGLPPTLRGLTLFHAALALPRLLAPPSFAMNATPTFLQK